VGLEEFRVKLGRYQVVGLDAMSFIHHFEGNPTFGPLTKVLFREVLEGRLRAVISVLVAGEVLTGAKRAGDAELVLRYRHIFSTFPNLDMFDVDMSVVEKASDLRAKYGLRTPDAIHIATALLNGAQAFVTNDAQLKQVAELDVLVLQDYVSETIDLSGIGSREFL